MYLGYNTFFAFENVRRVQYSEGYFSQLFTVNVILFIRSSDNNNDNDTNSEIEKIREVL